jgi:O-antigen/teichoic acid export membrane protein
MNIKQLFNSDKFYVLADQVVVSGVSFVTNLLLAKALGLTNFGLFSMIGLVQFFCLTVSMGMTTQIFQVVYPGLNSQQKMNYTSGLLMLQFIFLFLLLFVGVIFYSFLPLSFSSYKTLIPVACISISLFLLQDAIRKILITQLFFKKAFVIDVLTNVLQLLVLVIAWYKALLTVKTAWLIIGITFIPSIIIGLLSINFSRFSLSSLQYALQLQKDKMGWMLSSNLLQWCTGYFFVIAAGWWLGAAALGALRLAQYLFGLLNVALQAMENYTLPKFAGLKDKQAEYLATLKKQMLMLMLPLLAVLSIFSKQILILAGGESYAAYNYVIYGLSLVYILITIGYPVRIAIRSNHLNKQYFIGYILAAIFTISSAYFLLHNWQLYGVLAGLIFTQCITIGYWMVVLQHKKILTWKSFIWF